MSTDVVEVVVGVHGGVKFYHGAAKAARAYVERDRSHADDYYLGEGSGVASRLTASKPPNELRWNLKRTGSCYVCRVKRRCTELQRVFQR